MAGAVPCDNDTMTVRTWLPDPSHYPEQLTPLSATVWFAAIGRGLHEAMRQLRGPFGGFVARTELGWAYEGELEPDWEVDSDRLDAAAGELDVRWETELRPRVHEITELLHGMRPEGPDPAGAVDLLREMHELVLEQWTIHFLAVIPAQIAVEQFEQKYAAVVDGGDQFAVYRLLDAMDNDTNRADALLWDLCLRARELGVDDVLREFPPAPALDRLSVTAHGRRFLRSLDGYLERYGGRARWHELSLPREAERPWMTLESLRLFLEGEPPSTLMHRGDGGATDLLRRSPELSESLRAAQFGYALKEGHVHHIDYPGLLATREVLLGFARRLYASGLIREINDVWMLRLEELETLLVEPGDIDVAALVAARRDELADGRLEGPRPYLGEPPADSERHAALEKFYGSGDGQSNGTGLRGTSASPGTAEGHARIVHSTDDFSRVSRGDVLVAATTTPAWTPVFPSLGAVVTETGGVLCHGAIVAREYEIPAVVGVQGATRRITDGARVRVDGDKGEVFLI